MCVCVCVMLVGSGGSCKWCAPPGGAGLCDRRRVSVKDKFHLAARQPGRYLQRGNTNLPSFRALCAPENACRWGRWRRPASDVDGWFPIDLLDGSIGRKRKYKCNQQMTSARRVRNLSCRFQSLATGLLMFGTVPCPCVCVEWRNGMIVPFFGQIVSGWCLSLECVTYGGHWSNHRFCYYPSQCGKHRSHFDSLSWIHQMPALMGCFHRYRHGIEPRMAGQSEPLCSSWVEPRGR